MSGQQQAGSRRSVRRGGSGAAANAASDASAIEMTDDQASSIGGGHDADQSDHKRQKTATGRSGGPAPVKAATPQRDAALVQWLRSEGQSGTLVKQDLGRLLHTGLFGQAAEHDELPAAMLLLLSFYTKPVGESTLREHFVGAAERAKPAYQFQSGCAPVDAAV